MVSLVIMLALRYVYPITKLSTYNLLYSYLPMETFIHSSSEAYLEPLKSYDIVKFRLSGFHVCRGETGFHLEQQNCMTG